MARGSFYEQTLCCLLSIKFPPDAGQRPKLYYTKAKHFLPVLCNTDWLVQYHLAYPMWEPDWHGHLETLRNTDSAKGDLWPNLNVCFMHYAVVKSTHGLWLWLGNNQTDKEAVVTLNSFSNVSNAAWWDHRKTMTMCNVLLHISSNC